MGDVGVSSVDKITTARKAAAKLAARTDIRDVRLMKSSAEIMRRPLISPTLMYDLNSDAAVEYEPGGESFVVRGTYRLSIWSTPTMTAEDSSPEEHVTVAKIEFEHAALFVIEKDGNDPPEADELNAYAVSTGLFALYPYVREYIADVTSRLGLPPLTVGVLRIPVSHSGAANGNASVKSKESST